MAAYSEKQWRWIMDRYFLDGYNPYELARAFHVHRNSIVYQIEKDGRKRPTLSERMAEFYALEEEEM